MIVLCVLAVIAGALALIYFAHNGLLAAPAGTGSTPEAAPGGTTAAQGVVSDWASAKQYDTLAALNAYLQERIASRADTATFIVDTDDSDMPEIYLQSSYLVSGKERQTKAFSDYLSNQIFYMTPLLFYPLTSYDYGDEGRVLFKMELHYRPGVRIYDAWKKNPDAPEGLTNDERATLANAEAIVNAARATGATGVALERAIHDRLCETVTYKSSENDPHVTTAVGALLDGEANCQGYCDAFYLMATMAGFTVNMQSARPINKNYPRPPDTDETHVFNTILLDDEWYIVDATWDDAGDVVTHNYFNIGRWRPTYAPYSWLSQWEINPLADAAYGER